MMKVMDYEHPRISVKNAETGEETFVKMPCCGTKTGYHGFCTRKRRQSDFDDYGVGSVLYFQFIKYLGCQFLILALLGIPAMIFFYYG